MGCCVIFCAAEFDALARPIETDDYILAADGGLKHTRTLGIKRNEIGRASCRERVFRAV